uniref:Uncharacterized protein n=1 Tax=Pleurostichidium falkenbergii TaxID=121064 RepID=A0A4D6UZ06_9FLOR|nr:hypothetical protein [Pleurostichidium falkenbergii]QCH39693.1 hypothetical protein [Pleurostichidium falkenbergii]
MFHTLLIRYLEILYIMILRNFANDRNTYNNNIVFVNINILYNYYLFILDI